MKSKQMIMWSLLVLLTLMTWGCGSSRDSSGDVSSGSGLANAPTIGINACLNAQCHDPGGDVATGWLAGNHGNLGNMPDTGYFGSPATECTPCHDQTGDSANLLEDGLYNPADLSTIERPVTGCESCHGGGAFHNGVIAGLPFPTPDYDRCGQCHNETFDHNTHHPFADSIVENYTAGAHKNSIERAHATPALIRAKCSRCHSDEGFRQFYPLTVDFTRDQLGASLDPLADLTNVNPVQCRTCHDSHTSALRVAEVLIDPGTGPELAFSAQFRTCTACHNVFLNAPAFDAVAAKFDYELDPIALAADLDGTRNNHYHGAFVDMVQTHFDNPDTVAVEGYNINGADENACLNCHDGHGATKFEQVFASGIATEWGNEANFHGDYKVEAFNHGFDETDAVCMECHNGTEAVKVLEGLVAADLDGQPARVVACVTCHDLTAKSADGTAFELGARRIFKDAAGLQTTVHTFESGLTADLGLDDADNLICLNCHSGRKAGSSVDDEIASEDIAPVDGLADDGAYNFQNIHYRAAGASLFGNMAAGGYQFAGKAYASKFEHVASNDLCIECHNAHDGKLFIADPGFGPTGCVNCHTNIVADPVADYAGAIAQVRDIRLNGSLEDYDGDGNATEGIYYEVDGLKTVLLAAITGSGATFSANYPYFGNLTHAAQLQAAYNYQVVDKDPGSYAHNGDYIIQLLYDSLEAMSVAFPGLGINMSLYVREDSGHFASDGEPFRHWDEDPAMSTSCAPCHSSEGAAAFITNGTVTSDDFKSYTRGISAGLACEACHTAPFDPAGTTRSVASVTFNSGVVVDSTTAPLFFAGGNDSPLCMNCHQGRSSTPTVDGRIASGNLGFSNIHYFAAAASLFGTQVQGGYEYSAATSSFVADPVYAGQNTFSSHPDSLKTCEGCHMQEGGNVHDFTPVLARCNDCHTGASFEVLNMGVSTNHDDIVALKAELFALISTAGVTPLAGYPYFSGITTAAQLKACYNWQMADKEPCGYIHNGDYVKQLLYDSIVDLSTDEGAPVVPSVARP